MTRAEVLTRGVMATGAYEGLRVRFNSLVDDAVACTRVR